MHIAIDIHSKRTKRIDLLQKRNCNLFTRTQHAEIRNIVTIQRCATAQTLISTNGTKESLLRVLREIDTPATLRYEAYSRRRENGSSPFVPRKSRRDLTSSVERERHRVVHTSVGSTRYTYVLGGVCRRCAQREKKGGE